MNGCQSERTGSPVAWASCCSICSATASPRRLSATVMVLPLFSATRIRYHTVCCEPDCEV